MEMLVVVAIIGLLSGIVLTTFTGVRKLARDAKRTADLRQLNSAIEFYINDNGHAPYVGALNCNSTNTDPGGCVTSVNKPTQWAALQAELQPYLTKLPTDPCGQSCNTGDGSSGRWAMIYYNPPATVASLCQNYGCPLTNAQLNGHYAVFAGVMEVADTDYTSTYKGVPTFGFKTYSIGNSF